MFKDINCLAYFTIDFKNYTMKYLFILFLAFTIGCSKDKSDEECISYEVATVTNVNAPNTGAINEKIPIKIDYFLNNSCGNFENLSEIVDGDSTTIDVNAKYDGCYCLEVLVEETATYNFETSIPGDYEFKFKSVDNEYIVVVITIT